jgi:hypothetical protein
MAGNIGSRRIDHRSEPVGIIEETGRGVAGYHGDLESAGAQAEYLLVP